MIRSLYRPPDGPLRTGLSTDELPPVLREGVGLLWVDLCDEPHPACEEILVNVFGFHPLAVDDALNESHVPKVDDWGSYVYLVAHGSAFEPAGEGIFDSLELDIFLGPNYVVTHQRRPIAAVERVWGLCLRNERHVRLGAGRLLYWLLDELVADYMPAVDGLAEMVDEIEDQLFAEASPELIERVFSLKRALLRMRRVIAPQREVLNKLARGDFAVVSPEDRMFYRDVYDHLVRLFDLSESLRDLVGSVLETYLSVINNRMNEVMKTLTVITTMFMPISFIAGFFGMNFFGPTVEMRAWTGYLAFALTLVVMVAAPIGMVLWMRRRGMW